MKCALLAFIGILVLIPMVSAVENKLLVVSTDSRIDKLLFKLQGCSVNYEVGEVMVMECPEKVYIKNSYEISMIGENEQEPSTNITEIVMTPIKILLGIITEII